MRLNIISLQVLARHMLSDLTRIGVNSRFAGGPCVVLFAPASNAMPPRPVLSLLLMHPGLALRIATTSERLGYLVV
jgi:hypothetical protein